MSGLILLCLPGWAQIDSIAEDSVIYFHARLVDSLSSEPVQLAHVVNTNFSLATITDTLGYFRIRANPGDTIQISAIGYTVTQYILDDYTTGEGTFTTLYIKPFVYSIKQVSVNQLGSYDQFKQKFLRLTASDLPKGLHPSVMKDLNEDLEGVGYSGPQAIASPVTYFYMLWSKEGKSNRKLAEWMKQDEFADEIDYKFNAAMVSRVTGYEGPELNEFMEFCNFSRKFLLDANDYSIVEVILNKQKIYSKLKKD